MVWGGAGGVAHLEAVLEMDLADVLRELTVSICSTACYKSQVTDAWFCVDYEDRPGVYGRAIGANETGDVLAVGTSRNDIVCFDRREGTR